MKPRLLLYCDVVNSRFCLGTEGEEERHDFSDLREALKHAARIISEDTAITIYNELGKVVVESIITPRRTG